VWHCVQGVAEEGTSRDSAVPWGTHNMAWQERTQAAAAHPPMSTTGAYRNIYSAIVATGWGSRAKPCSHAGATAHAVLGGGYKVPPVW
jgi:hypothetical protein